MSRTPSRAKPKRTADAAPKPARQEGAGIGEVRTRILDAALKLFEDRGFDGTAVPEIARRAGIATGSIYRHFSSKDALVNALYREWKLRYTETVLSPPPESATPREVFGHYWRGMAAFAQRHPIAARFLDLHHHRAYLDKESKTAERKTHDLAAQFVAQGVAAGVVRPIDPMLLVALMTGAMRGLLQFAGDGELVLDQATTAAAEDCIWNAIKA